MTMRNVTSLRILLTGVNSLLLAFPIMLLYSYYFSSRLYLYMIPITTLILTIIIDVIGYFAIWMIKELNKRFWITIRSIWIISIYVYFCT